MPSKRADAGNDESGDSSPERIDLSGGATERREVDAGEVVYVTDAGSPPSETGTVLDAGKPGCPHHFVYEDSSTRHATPLGEYVVEMCREPDCNYFRLGRQVGWSGL